MKEFEKLTNEVGAPVADNENSLTAGPRGPVVMQDVWLMEKMAHFNREVIPEKPPKTVYSLTPFGQSIVPILDAMCQWGNNYLDGLDVQPPCCQSRK